MFNKVTFLASCLLLLGVVSPSDLCAQTVIKGFTLKNVDGKEVSLSAFEESSAIVVIFTGNHCVYSKKYEDRILRLAAEYSPKKVQFLLINSNSPELSEDDSFEAMQFRAQEKGYTFPYLQDPDQAIARAFGALKNPDAFVLTPAEEGFKVVYAGSIDDNPLIAEAVTVNYVSKALDQVLTGNTAPFAGTAVQGCGIKGLDE